MWIFLTGLYCLLVCTQQLCVCVCVCVFAHMCVSVVMHICVGVVRSLWSGVHVHVCSLCGWELSYHVWQMLLFVLSVECTFVGLYFCMHDLVHGICTLLYNALHVCFVRLFCLSSYITPLHLATTGNLASVWFVYSFSPVKIPGIRSLYKCV